MDKEKIKQFILSQREAGVPDEQIHSFLVQKGAITTPKPEEPEQKTFMEKVASFTGGEKIAQGLGQALANKEISKSIEETQKTQFDIQGNLINRIKEKKALGEDTSRLENALNLLNEDIQQTGQGAEKLLNQKELTTKQVVGDALQLGTTILGAGTLPGGPTTKFTGALGKVPGLTKAAPSVVKGVTSATSFVKGAVQGAKSGAIAGGLYGTSSGIASGLKQDKDTGEIIESGIMGGIGGGISGGILGGLIGGVSGGLKGRSLRKKVLDSQIEVGDKAAPQISQKAKELAKAQGFDDVDVDFMASLSKQDKTKAKKMVELAEMAKKNKRAIERPIDVPGDSMVDRVKFIRKVNSEAGKKVNEVAKTLRGQAVDANPIAEKAQSLIDDLGVTRTPKGTLDFSNSVFKNTPEIQSKLEKFILEIPTGQADAYDVHIFKKSIDELVQYGTKGEGLKGNASNILKALRVSADDVLDNAFDAYNQANTDFRNTRQVLDVADDLFGKKVGIVKEKGGALLRSVFSNSNQRPRVLALTEQLDKVTKQYGGKFDDNLLDQTIFAEILEDVYGTQAVTSLQGEVAKAIKGTARVIEGIRNPIKGVGDLVATGAEKSLGINEENKRKIFNAFLR
jgi:hypothetical protein